MDPIARMTLSHQDIAEGIMREKSMGRIMKLGTEEQIAHSDGRIREIAIGCSQWLAMAFKLQEGGELLMFRGQMAQLLRIIVLETLFYEIICREYSGRPMRYHPLLGSEAALQSSETAERTLQSFRSVFGSGLSREFTIWEHAAEHGLLVPVGLIHR